MVGLAALDPPYAYAYAYFAPDSIPSAAASFLP